MIEKLNFAEMSLYDENNNFVGTMPQINNSGIVGKINELIDVVNTLVEENNIHEKQIDELQMKEPVDNFAEQRKWIGKLCKFWDNDDTQQLSYGVLTKIDTESGFGVQYCCNDEYDYDDCEPVKPDDSILYKGE